MIRLDEVQQQAVDAACASRFSVITGGAGTGKTTIIDTITKTLESKGEDVKLAAFAGKAAARLREACKHPSSTIHRMLGYNGTQFLSGDLSGSSVVIDEASMVSSDIMAEIMRRNPKRLTLVGDPAQLPPVGKGQPFHDLIKLRSELVTELTTCYRATEAVYRSALAVRAGNRPEMQLTSPNESWKMINTGDASQTQAAVMKWVEHFDFEQDIILCPRNGEDKDPGPATVKALNAAIVQMLSPREDLKEYAPGDRVINTKNFPKADVWNGTTGTVHSVDIDGGVWVRTDIPVIDWDKTKDEKQPIYTDTVLFDKKEMRRNLEYAYALTVHKSQGSQYRRVLFIALKRDAHSLMDRSLIYTAITRTKQACVVVGELAAFWQGIQKINHKRTVLQELAL